MTKNMGAVDRGVRALLIGPAAIAGAFLVGAGSISGIVLFAVAGIMFATAAAGYCPLYAIFGVSTVPRRPAAHA